MKGRVRFLPLVEMTTLLLRDILKLVTHNTQAQV